MYNPYPYETITNRVEGDGPVWSPDGKSMAYVLDDVLWTLPVDKSTGAPAGPPRQLTNEVADQLSWSGDSQHILYDSAGTLRIVSANGGRPTTVPVHLNWRPQAAPSGEKVIHAGTVWTGASGAQEQHNVDIVVSGQQDRERRPGEAPLLLRAGHPVRQRGGRHGDPGPVGRTLAREHGPAVRRQPARPARAGDGRHERDLDGRRGVPLARAGGVPAIRRDPGTPIFLGR